MCSELGVYIGNIMGREVGVYKGNIMGSDVRVYIYAISWAEKQASLLVI